VKAIWVETRMLGVRVMQAQFKLGEAKHFLEQMKNSSDKEIFLFNLDAFLSASRSVTWVLQNEFSNDTRFQKWYNDKQREMQADPLLTFFKDMRNAAVKAAAPDVMAQTHVSIVEVVRITETVSIRKISPDGKEEVFHFGPEKVDSGAKKSDEGGVTITHKFFFAEKPEQDIMALCSLYFEKLAAIVEEAKKIMTDPE